MAAFFNCAAAHVSVCSEELIPCDACDADYCFEHYHNDEAHPCLKRPQLDRQTPKPEEHQLGLEPYPCPMCGVEIWCPKGHPNGKMNEHLERECRLEDKPSELQLKIDIESGCSAFSCLVKERNPELCDVCLQNYCRRHIIAHVCIRSPAKYHEAMSKQPLFYTVESDPEPFSATWFDCSARNCEEKSTLLPQQCKECKKYFCHKHLDDHYHEDVPFCSGDFVGNISSLGSSSLDGTVSPTSSTAETITVEFSPSKKANEESPEKEKIDKAKAIKWYIEKEKPKVVGINPQGSDYEPWFHGPINREEAEDLMKPEPVGSYLVSLSDRAKGYNMTYKLPPKKLKFYVEAKKNGKYYANTENQSRSFNSLRELVEYYKQNPLRKDFEERFTHPVGQRDPTDPDFLPLLEYW